MVEPYAKAPVTEAVIEIRIAEKLAPSELKKARNRLLPHYPQIEDLTEFQLEMKAGVVQPAVKQRPVGFRAKTEDGTDSVNVQVQALNVSRIAPYLGWEPFFERMTRDHEIWASVAGRRTVSRLGVRFINRLDIPLENGKYAPQDFVQMGAGHPQLPFNVTQQEYLALFVYALNDEPYHIRCSAGTVQPELIDCGAVQLDIDVYRTVDVPQLDDDIWSALQRMREIKNMVFETFMSDRAHELFK